MYGVDGWLQNCRLHKLADGPATHLKAESYHGLQGGLKDALHVGVHHGLEACSLVGSLAELCQCNMDCR